MNASNAFENMRQKPKEKFMVMQMNVQNVRCNFIFI
jgi:hypothetical protein